MFFLVHNGVYAGGRYDIIAIFVLVARLVFNHDRLPPGTNLPVVHVASTCKLGIAWPTRQIFNMPSPQFSLMFPLPLFASPVSSPTSTLSFSNPIFPNRRVTVDEATYDRDGDPKVIDTLQESRFVNMAISEKEGKATLISRGSPYGNATTHSQLSANQLGCCSRPLQPFIEPVPRYSVLG